MTVVKMMANAEDLLLYSIGATENEGGIPLHGLRASMRSFLLYYTVRWCYMVQYNHSSVYTLAAQTHIGHQVSKKESKM